MRDARKTKEDLKRTYDSIAADFSQTRQTPWKQVEDLLKQLPKRSLVLDVGGGTGRHSLLAQKLGHVAVCYDFSEGQLDEAKKQGVEQCIQGDMTELLFADSSFDCVLVVASLHHLPTENERLQSLKECLRVLKPKGIMLVSVWRKGQKRFEGKEKDGDIDHTWRKEYPRYYHLFSEEELKELAKKADVSMQKLWTEGDNVWLLGKKQT